MLEALVITAVLVGVLACPVMMWLGRRGIGPGCAMDGCADSKKDEETIDALRRRERELSARIARLQADEERLTARAAGDD